MSEGAGLGIAGVRLADGRQVFVEGAPSELDHGMRVAIRADGQDHEGTVSVAPRLIVQRDPEALLGTYSRTIRSEPAGLPTAAEPPLFLLLAGEDAPDPVRLNEMLNLARAEAFRLDD